MYILPTTQPDEPQLPIMQQVSCQSISGLLWRLSVVAGGGVCVWRREKVFFWHYAFLVVQWEERGWVVGWGPIRFDSEYRWWAEAERAAKTQTFLRPSWMCLKMQTEGFLRLLNKLIPPFPILPPCVVIARYFYTVLNMMKHIFENFPILITLGKILSKFKKTRQNSYINKKFGVFIFLL